MDSKTEPASEAKRIERQAKDYADNNYKKNHYPDNWENSYCGYIAGANEEHNRAQEEITRLKAELEMERELRKEAVDIFKGLVSQRGFRGGFPDTTIFIESLIEKSKN